MSAHLVFRRWKWPLFDLYVPLLLGFFLSCSMEITQLWVRTRNTSALDVLTNVIGTVIGIVLGVIFENTAQSVEVRLSSFHPSDRSALMMIFFWAAWLVFPFFPLTGHTVPWQKVHLFLSAPPLMLLPFLSAAAAWFVLGRMLEAAGFRSPPIWLALSILMIPAQFFLIDRQPLPSDLLGAIAGVLLFALRDRTRHPTGSEAWAFLAIVALRGVAPFHLASHSTAISWIPFRAFLTAEWLHAILVLIEKTFYYGAAIWLLRAAGIRLLRASVIVAVILGTIELVQTHIPGRTPDITDPLLAILIAFGIAILSRRRVVATLSPERETQFQSAE